VLLVGALEQMLCNIKVTDVGRLGAFAKRMASLACHGGNPAEALGCLAVSYRTLRRYPRWALLGGLLCWTGCWRGCCKGMLGRVLGRVLGKVLGRVLGKVLGRVMDGAAPAVRTGAP
jgi:hypothetical protein